MEKPEKDKLHQNNTPEKIVQEKKEKKEHVVHEIDMMTRWRC